MSSIIIQNCNMCELDIPAKFALKVYNEFSIRHPQAFYLKRKVPDWDGKVHFVNKRGQFKIGLLPEVINYCESLGLKVGVEDLRKPVPKGEVVTEIGKYKLRPEQIKAVASVLNNTVKGKPFHIGVLDYTVNAGKSLIMASLYYSFKKQLKTLLITNDADWLSQAKEEFKQYLPGENITFIQGGKVNNWGNFSIGMVQSIARNIKKYQKELTQVDMVLVDEADLAGSKSYQNVLMHLFNTRVRIGLSGTIYMSKLIKDKLKNMNLEAFFGKVVQNFTLAQSIKKGYSSKVIVKMIPSEPYYGKNYLPKEAHDYPAQYDEVITNNYMNLFMVEHRLSWNLNRGRFPALIVCKHIKHCENIYNHLKAYLDKAYNIAYVHVDTPAKQRKKIMQDFREGKIHILVSTTIIARGKNFPLLKYMINAAGMNGQEKSIQFLGRLVRTHESKSKVYLDDLMYPGTYLARHSRHRKVYYQKQKLKVILMEKIWKKHPYNPLPF